MDKRTLSIPVIVLTIIAAVFTLAVSIFLILTNPSTSLRMNPSKLPNNPQNAEISDQNEMVEKAKEDLAQKLSFSSNDIHVKNITKKEWGDASLGCSQAGMAYIQLVTPGYQILLETNGKTYDYRSDLEGRVELCAK